MTAKIIDGKQTALDIRKEIAEQVSSRIASGQRPPGLAVILVGEDPASDVYVRGKERAAEAAGFHSVIHRLDASTSMTELLELVQNLNDDDAIDGILCQSPLPKHLDEQEVILAISPDKDVDGFHPVNAGRLAIGLPGFVSCTPLGIRELLLRYKIETQGKVAVVLGRSHLVGMPMALLLMQKGEGGNATTVVCHSRTAEIEEECRRADILIAAIGKPHFVKGDMIKPGATVIDVGINRIDDPAAPKGSRLVGDVDFEAAKEVAGAITPVPGGVGPMTIAMLLRNTLDAWLAKI